MQALVWILRFFIVLVLVWFAVKNAQPIEIHGIGDQVWQSPLVFVLFVVFAAGMVIGLLAWVPTVVRQRREVSRLRRSAATLAAMPAPPRTTGEPPSGTDVHGV